MLEKVYLRLSSIKSKICCLVHSGYKSILDKSKTFPSSTLNFVADGYSAYPLAKHQFELKENKSFNLTQII